MREARAAEGTDVPEWPMCVSDLTMLKSRYDMSYFVLIHYEAGIYKRSSEVGSGETCVLENLCIVLWVTCIATPL